MTGLTVFAALGTYAIHSIGGRTPRVALSSSYKFFKGISADRLKLSNREIVKLNRSFRENREVLTKAVLTVAGQGTDQDPAEMTSHVKLKFFLQLQGKGGMTYSPENISCERGKLVLEISRYVSKGAKVLTNYEASPEFKGSELKIMDM